jgi:hypothetical protein
MKSIDTPSPKVRLAVQILLFVTAFAFICFGVYRGEVETVFAKAVRVCLECVGIG